MKYFFYSITSLFFLKDYHMQQANEHASKAEYLIRQANGDKPYHHLAMKDKHLKKLRKVNRAIKFKA